MIADPNICKRIFMSEDFDQVIAYHQRTKHQPQAMAPGPKGLDWSNQPDPFRSYEAVPQISLKRQGFSPPAQEGGVGRWNTERSSGLLL